MSRLEQGELGNDETGSYIWCGGPNGWNEKSGNVPSLEGLKA